MIEREDHKRAREALLAKAKEEEPARVLLRTLVGAGIIVGIIEAFFVVVIIISLTAVAAVKSVLWLLAPFLGG